MKDNGPGMVTFELAASQDRADEILAEWGEEGRDAARESLWIDFAFLLAYGALLTLALAAARDLARGRGWGRLARIGAVVVYFGALAAAFDVLENACLLLTLDSAGAAFPVLATIFATCKFALLAIALAYLLAAMALRMRKAAPSLPLLLLLALVAPGCGDDDSEEREPAKPFAPPASLTALGGTERTDKPELVLRVEPQPGEANIRSAKLTLPAAFLVDQTALGGLCSERELEQDDCRGRKAMGAARVVSPAYDGALKGPVYAVSGSGGLPRLAYVLGGAAQVLLRGRIEVEGVRIQAGVADAPDVPLRIFELRITGGKPGYLVLSRDVCRRDAIADVSFTSHEGQRFARRVPLDADCDG